MRCIGLSVEPICLPTLLVNKSLYTLLQVAVFASLKDSLQLDALIESYDFSFKLMHSHLEDGGGTKTC